MAEERPARRAVTVVVEPERSDPWLRRFGGPGMTWCVVREVETVAAATPGGAPWPSDSELESLVHSWLTRATGTGAEWVARISGPCDHVARSIDRLYDGELPAAYVAMAAHAEAASVTLAVAVNARDIHLLVRRAWHHSLTLALLRVRGAATGEVVAALDRGDDELALSWSDRAAVCQPGARRCTLGASDPAAPPGLSTRLAIATSPPEQPPRAGGRRARRRPWRRPAAVVTLGGLLLGTAVILLLTGVLGPGVRTPSHAGGVEGITADAATSASLPTGSPPTPSPSTSPSAPTSPATATAPASVRLAASPSQRTGEAVTFDGATTTGVLFGGTGRASTVLGDTWLFSGGTWTEAHPPVSPPPRTGAAMAYNPATGHVVLVGGTSATSDALDDTWIWDGTTWSAVTTLTRPAPGAPVGLAYDEATASLVLMTRVTAGASTVRIWTFANATWTDRSTSVEPTAGAGAALAYDPALSRLVLVDVAGNVTHLWDGASWATAPGPGTAVGSTARLAYNSIAQQLVLVVHGEGQPDTTWTYDGSKWSRATSPLGPVEVAALMPAASGVIAFGGPSAADDLTEAWRWSAAGWSG